MQRHDYERLQSLYDERLLEIKREGVVVALNYRHQIAPAYLECSSNDYLKFKSILDSNVSLELCDIKGIPLMKILRRQYFTKREIPKDKYRVYLQNKNAMRCYAEGQNYILVKNNATIGVLSIILERRLQGDRYFQKIQNFIGDDCCVRIDMDQDLKLDFQYQEDLNREQNLAIQKSFNNHLTFVKGPPGCGKSKTVSRMVRMMAERGLQVLVGSISNIANQTLINQLVREVAEHNKLCQLARNVKMRKIGMLINYSRKVLQKMNEQANSFSINNQLYQLILKYNNSAVYNQHNIMQEIEKLQKGETVSNTFYSIYMKCYNQLIYNINIVVSTTINSFKLLEYSPFKPDVGIMDEAAQASWTDTYGFLSFGVKRMVFVGDQKQLRPTVIGDATANQILKQTMFERLSLKNQQYFVHLVRQYRMHPKISEFPNLYVYEGKLVDDQVTFKQRQSTISYFKKYPISFVTHNFSQNVIQSSKTVDNKKGKPDYSNILEGSLIMDLLFLIPFEEWKNIGILTFYDMQCQALKQNLKGQIPNFQKSGLTVKTIDGYQGGQKSYIIISTVRCNPEKNPGFCTEMNRVNVALTRAKKGLVVFGSPETLSQGKAFGDEDQNIWGKFYQFMLKRNQVLDTEQFHNVLQQKQILIKQIQQKQPEIQIKILNQGQNLLQKFYQQLIMILESFHSLKIQQNDEELLQNNPKLKKEAKVLIGQMKNVNKQSLGDQQIGVRQKVKNYLQIESLEKPKGQKQNQGGKMQIKNQNNERIQSFQQKFFRLAKESMTLKQCEFSLNFINQLSSTIYEVMQKNPSIINAQNLKPIKDQIACQKQKLVESCWVQLKQDIIAQILKNLSTLKQTEKLKSLVSSKLKFKVLSDCQKEMQRLGLGFQAPLNNKF